MKKDELKSQNFIEEDTKQTSSELVKKIKIEKTPFELVFLEDKELGFIALGNHILSPTQFKDAVDCEEWLFENIWDVICKIIVIIIKF